MSSSWKIDAGAGVLALLLTLGASSGMAADLMKDCQLGKTAACTEILQGDPSNTAARANRGVGFRISGDNDRAIADFDEVIRIDPRIAGYYLERGLALDAKGEHLQAIDDFSEAIQRNGTLVQAHFGRAMAYEATAQKDQSAADLNRAVNLNGNMVAALYMQRGNDLSKARRFGDAITAFDRSIALKSDWPLAYFGRGAALEETGNTERAATDFRKCIALNGMSDLERQRTRDARAHLERLEHR
jgi:tetratricopeptide (TPR) repeat protein